jgi:phospholipid/cholesterol/gamma-HCH transport system substrate-binding protein
LQRLLVKSEGALENFNKAMVSINSVVGDEELTAALKASLKEMPETFAQAKQTLTEAREAFGGIKEMSSRANTNLANIEKFTKPLGERGENIVGNIDSSIETIDALLTQLNAMSENLNNSDGTLGKLVRDDELYNRLNNAAVSIEQVTRDARPIVDDLKVFAQKIADDPRQLGLKGMIDKRPTGVGLNFNTSLRRKKALEEDAVWIED